MPFSSVWIEPSCIWSNSTPRAASSSTTASMSSTPHPACVAVDPPAWGVEKTVMAVSPAQT